MHCSHQSEYKDRIRCLKNLRLLWISSNENMGLCDQLNLANFDPQRSKNILSIFIKFFLNDSKVCDWISYLRHGYVRTALRRHFLTLSRWNYNILFSNWRDFICQKEVICVQMIRNYQKKYDKFISHRFVTYFSKLHRERFYQNLFWRIPSCVLFSIRQNGSIADLISTSKQKKVPLYFF